MVAGERKGSGSHSGKWRGSGVLSGAREMATAVSCTIDIDIVPRKGLEMRVAHVMYYVYKVHASATL